MKAFAKLTASALAAVLMCGAMPALTYADSTREVLVTTTEELIAALNDAQAGDEIILQQGVYQNDTWTGEWAAFYSGAEGTAEMPITIRSQDPENPATICGVNEENKMALYITGDYWIIQDLKISTASKGIMLDNSNYSIISNCEVFNIGTEAIHLRDNSSYCVVEECYVHDTGTVTAGYGEAVYIGSAYSTTGYGYECHYNTVKNCRFGPNVAAEHVDIKEYTIGNVVEGCTFDGTGITGENYANSFVAIKGNNTIIRNNTGYRNGCENVLYAFTLSVLVEGWGQNNKIYDNTVYLDTTDCYLVKEWNCATQVFRNTAEPAGVTYTGNKTIQVLGFEMNGDSNEDGLFDTTDIKNLQSHLLGNKVTHISGENSDLYADVQLDAVDLCLLKRQLMQGSEIDTPIISFGFTEEAAGKWRMCNGLGNRTVTYHLSASPNGNLNMGGGYWDPNYENDDGTKGKWIQLSLGSFTPDESGNVTISLDLPEAVTNVALQVYTVKDSSGNALEKDSVELIKATTK